MANPQTAPTRPAPPAAPAPAPSATPPSLADDKRTSFPCSLVTLRVPQVIPGDSCASRVLCTSDVPGRQRWTATFIPTMRAFEVTWFPVERGRQIEVAYIPEGNVASFSVEAAT